MRAKRSPSRWICGSVPARTPRTSSRTTRRSRLQPGCWWTCWPRAKKRSPIWKRCSTRWRRIPAALNEIRAELKSQGYLKYYKQRDKRQKPADFLRFTSSDGFEILVGRNNAQNDKLTLHTARGKDLWFHVQKAPGSHVVVMSRGEEIPDTTKQEAAELAVIYSSTYKAGTGAKVAVDTTEVKNIWKASGAKPGMVLYEVYTTVYVTPRDGLAEQLKKR